MYKRDGAGVTAPVLSDGVATMVPGISERSGGAISRHSSVCGEFSRFETARNLRPRRATKPPNEA